MHLRDRARAVLDTNPSVDVLMVINSGNADPNMKYLSGMARTPERSVLFATRDRIAMTAHSIDYGNMVAHRTSDDLEILRIDTPADGLSATKEFLHGKVVGLSDRMELRSYFGLPKWFKDGKIKPRRLVDMGSGLASKRDIKDGEEIGLMCYAAHITYGGIAALQQSLRRGVTEKELAIELDDYFKRHGCMGSAFGPTVAFDAKSALPHSTPGDTKLQNDTVVLVDCGAREDTGGYCADITRTFMFNPKSGSKKAERFEEAKKVVIEAQVEAGMKLSPGVKGKTVHNAAAAVIDSHEDLRGHFTHPVGHSLGLEYHDSRTWALWQGEQKRLQKGMAVTIEPGVYFDGEFGVRWEDAYLVMQRGARRIG